MKNTNESSANLPTVPESLKRALDELTNETTSNTILTDLIRDITRFYWNYYFTVCHLKELSQAKAVEDIQDYIRCLNLNKSSDDLFTLTQITEVMASVADVVSVWQVSR